MKCKAEVSQRGVNSLTQRVGDPRVLGDIWLRDKPVVRASLPALCCAGGPQDRQTSWAFLGMSELSTLWGCRICTWALLCQGIALGMGCRQRRLKHPHSNTLLWAGSQLPQEYLSELQFFNSCWVLAFSKLLWNFPVLPQKHSAVSRGQSFMKQNLSVVWVLWMGCWAAGVKENP